ncbi:hypothetical protein [Pandoraea bronchicola]|uniref:hypothetical protein n=1 Tax=Pandoraea bronchicola TaxID=2508287 RepID=UPI001241728D|nr:hypothetical protein [Pandoraea bronchicola]
MAVLLVRTESIVFSDYIVFLADVMGGCMGRAANLRLVVQSALAGVTLRSDGTWETSGDPHNLLGVDGGTWEHSFPQDTKLVSAAGDLLALVNFMLNTANPDGTQHDALQMLTPASSAVGDYYVLSVIDT